LFRGLRLNAKREREEIVKESCKEEFAEGIRRRNSQKEFAEELAKELAKIFVATYLSILWVDEECVVGRNRRRCLEEMWSLYSRLFDHQADLSPKISRRDMQIDKLGGNRTGVFNVQ
jgi:hypothetical protein